MATRIAIALRQRGVPVDAGIYTIDALAQSLENLKNLKNLKINAPDKSPESLEINAAAVSREKLDLKGGGASC